MLNAKSIKRDLNYGYYEDLESITRDLYKKHIEEMH